eukprot:scaffold212917_cov23-Cyclotella_meneghiniana.AAC.1
MAAQQTRPLPMPSMKSQVIKPPQQKKSCGERNISWTTCGPIPMQKYDIMHPTWSLMYTLTLLTLVQKMHVAGRQAIFSLAASPVTVNPSS